MGDEKQQTGENIAEDPYSRPHKRKIRNKKGYLRFITIVATLGSLLFGYDTGIINGALPFMEQPDQLNLTPVTTGFVTSSLILGAAIGALFGGRLSDRFGRRKLILGIAVLFVITTLGCSLAPNAGVMVFFRFVLGLATGGASAMVPAFLSEMAPSEIRGRMVTNSQLMIVTGQLLAYITNAVVGITMAEVGHAWRYMLVIGTIPAILLWIGMFFVPESPRWFALHGRWSAALNVLKQIRSEKRAEQELKIIRTSIEHSSKQKKASLKDLNVPWIRRIILIGIGLAITQQITGINSIMYYSTEILTQTGLGTQAALVANIANGVIAVIAVCVGMWLLGRVRRRPMLLTGVIGTTSSVLLIGIMSKLFEGTAALPFIILSLTVLFLAFQQSAVGPVTWLMLSEIFPAKIRGIGMGISVFFLWMTNFTISLTFPIILDSLGLSMAYFLFGICGICAIGFVSKFVPETKGLSLEQVEAHFRQQGRPSKNTIGKARHL